MFWKECQEIGPLAEKWVDRNSNRTRKREREGGHENGVLNGSSPEIRDSRVTSDTPGLPLADCIRNLHRKYRREGGVGNEKERKRVQEINQDILQNQNVCKKLTKTSYRTKTCARN